MGILDQILNALGKKATAKVNQAVHQASSTTSQTQSVSATNSNHLHINELDIILEKEKAHYQSYKKQCVDEYRQLHYVDRAFTALVKEHSFEAFSEIPDDLKTGSYYKQKVSELLDHYMRMCSKIYAQQNGSISLLHKYIKELTYFPELESVTQILLANQDYFSSEQHASRSILSIDSPIGAQFERILANGMPKSIGRFATAEMLNRQILDKKEVQGRKLSDDEVNFCVVSNAVLSDISVDELDELKHMVLYLALNDDRSRVALDTNAVASRVAVMAFGLTTVDGSNLILNPGVDFVLADAIRSAKSGNIKEFNERFEGWLETCGHLIDVDQYGIFQAVFSEIGAYSSECMLLDYVIQAEIEHTSEQEKRLAFLKENSNLLAQNMEKFTPVTPPCEVVHPYDIQSGQVLAYDHRFLTWNTNEIEKYFKGLSISGKKQEMAAVVDKWSKNVTIDSRKWDNTIITQLICDTISQEFDLGYEVMAVSAGVVIDGEVDTTSAIYIKATEEARYQNLSFLVVGEPMTKNQVSLSILVIATPEAHFGSNDKLLKQIIAVKEKHNPRLETYIETFKSIVIERMNSWISQVNGAQDIY